MSGLADLVDDELARFAEGREVWERVLLGPARDLLARPGKQLRAALVGAGWALAGGGREGPPAALLAAIEVLHAGSLVIDDIEDGAELRRGEPSLHRRYGLPIALNTGNWMYFWAFALVDRVPLAEPVRSRLNRAMLGAVLACHEGQALDVGVDVTRVPRDELRALVARSTALKSGSLVALAMELGAIAATAAATTVATDVARTPTIEAIAELGHALGLGLQMLDDLGAVTCVSRRAKSREDLLGLRLTWAWVWASEGSDPGTWQRLFRLARQVAERRGDTTPVAQLLGQLAKHGRTEVHAQLATALDRIRPLASPDAVGLVERELHRLEVSYG